MRIIVFAMFLISGLIGCSTTSPAGQVQAGVPESTGTSNIINRSLPTSASMQRETVTVTSQSSVESTTSMTDTVTSATVSLVDPTIPPATVGEPEWQYYREAMADFDGDGVVERAVLIARVQVSDGRPIWDDSQPWQMYIEEANMDRTYVYARNVQLGNVEALLAHADQQQTPTLVLIERTPQQLAIHEIHYGGPSDVFVVELIQRELDSANGFSGTAN